ncbi:MAG: hypothetical protein HY892_04150 [Deltaproteobacteria bacterium]|nr:hypothetical protein [Deltaproteobacteria bacterium]
MDKEDLLLRQAADPRHIPGIYNYCDRWCERCPMTSRCLNFTMEDEGGDRAEDLDVANDRFWKKMSESLRVAFDLLQDLAAEEGIDLEAVEEQEPEEENQPVHILIPMVRRYMDLVEEWLQNQEPEAEKPAPRPVPSHLKKVDSGAPAPAPLREEALEIIAWYQVFLPPKLARALKSKQDEEDLAGEDFPKDSDGSAKIALIAMDRSLGAWGELSNQMESQRKTIVKLAAYLQRLREITEREFPQARAFIRPGFDTPPQDDL